MANKLNKELQEQINLRKELLKLSYEEQSQIDDTASTLQSRTSILQQLASISESDLSRSEKSAQLASVRSDLEAEVTRYKEIGHTVQADSFDLEKEVLGTMEDKLTSQENVNSALTEAGDTLLGGMITKGKQLAETMKKPGGILVVGLTAAVALMMALAKQTDAIGEKFGAVGVTEFSQELREANVTAVALGRSLDDVMGSLQVIADDFGISTKGSKELLSTITDTSVAIGMSNDEGARLFGTFKSILGLTTEESNVLAKQTALLAKQEGLIPSTVMKDMAGSADAVAKFTKDGGANIAKAAIQARKLGVNLDTAAKMAEGLLDFESSIEKEMQASVLIGRQLNFQRARQLALTGDIAGATKEIVSQIGSEAEFNKLNSIQRQALADSIGISSAELAKFVRLQGKSKSEMMSLESMSIDELVSEDALSAITGLLNKLKAIGAEILAVVAGFTEFIGITSDSSIGADVLKIALIALGAGLVWIGISAVASALKVKLMSKILGSSGAGLATFAASGSAAIPLLLTIAALGLALAAVIAAV